MDDMKILKRAWAILWNYRALWIFGFILALTVGGTTYSRMGSNSGYQFNQNESVQNSGRYYFNWDEDIFRDPQSFMHALEDVGTRLTYSFVSKSELNILIGFVVFFFLVVFLVGIFMTFLRYISETTVIRMVDGYESTATKHTIKEGFKLGWSRASWRLFLIDLLLSTLPVMLMLCLLGLIGWGLAIVIMQSINQAGGIVMIAFLTGLVFLVICLFSIYFLVISLVRYFIVRSCALEDKNVGEAIRAGFSMVRKYWKEIGKFWLIMIGLGIGWAILSFVLVFLLIPFFVLSILVAIVVAGLPGLLMGGIAAFFLETPLAMAVGILFTLPLFIPLVAAPALAVEGLAQVFRSTCWTLVYRELKALPGLPALEGELPNPG